MAGVALRRVCACVVTRHKHAAQQLEHRNSRFLCSSSVTTTSAAEGVLYCTVLCYTCLYSEKETQGPARLRPGKKGGREGRSRC